MNIITAELSLEIKMDSLHFLGNKVLDRQKKKTNLKNESKDDLVFNLGFSLLGFHLIVQSRTSKKNIHIKVLLYSS